MSQPLAVGLIGAGVISDTYLENLTSFPDVRVIAVGDLLVDRARSQAEKYGVPSWGSADDVLENPDVQVVVNLTIPSAHIDISTRAVQAGKHVWTEKPIGLDRESTRRLLQLADAAGVRVGSAPDTILGPGFQTAKRAIARGVIGTPLFAQTAFQTQGPDLWHPSPAFLFARGAGPLLDMGPYYFSALVSLFGSIDRVAAVGSKAHEERSIRTGPDAGTTFPVEAMSTMQIVTAFESGQHAQSTVSFDSALERHGVVEIHGTEGSIVLPDPNRFEGHSAHVKPLGMLRDGMSTDQPWIELEQAGIVTGRGLGVLDMVRAIAEDRPHIASGALGHHVVDALLAAEESAETGVFVSVESAAPAIPPVAEDFDPFAATL